MTVPDLMYEADTHTMKINENGNGKLITAAKETMNAWPEQMK